MPRVSCTICKKPFYAKPRHLKRGWGKYCSKACQYTGQHTGKVFHCATCDKKVYRTPKEVRVSITKKFFCNRSCSIIWKNINIFSGSNHVNWKNGESRYRNIILRSEIEQKCKRCALADKRILAVHHVDKNRRNNSLENLKWLCHNCHFLIHHDKEEYKKFMVAMV